jgi:hypothetical protein
VGAEAGVFALLVVAGAEVAVLGFRVGQERVGDAELCSCDGALGFPLGHVPAQAPVSGAEEGLGPPAPAASPR